METRRNGIIKTLVAAMAYLLMPKSAHTQSTSDKLQIDRAMLVSPMYSLNLNLDNSRGINVELKGERIHITPEDIMEALRKPTK